jgi:RNA-binding protein Tab2/Atab2
VYQREPGYDANAQTVFLLDLAAPLDLPDALRGEQWQFVQLPLGEVCAELEQVQKVGVETIGSGFQGVQGSGLSWSTLDPKRNGRRGEPSPPNPPSRLLLLRKALVCQSGEDLHPCGPDASGGWGRGVQPSASTAACSIGIMFCMTARPCPGCGKSRGRVRRKASQLWPWHS